MIRRSSISLTLVFILLGSSVSALSHCESPAPSRFDSRVFGGGGATVFDMASQYQARRSGRAPSGGSVFVASGNQPVAGGITAGDLLGGLTAAAGVASAIQGAHGGVTGATQPSPTGEIGQGTCGLPGGEVACSR